MKKLLCSLMATLLSAVMLFGCGQQGETAKGLELMLDNEISTYEKIDTEKTRLIVSTIGHNADIENLSAAFETQNPDIQVICLDLTGGTEDYKPVVDWVKNGIAPDVMFINSDSFIEEELVTEYFEDLSARSIVGNFEAQSLDRMAINGAVYFLPAPSEINCIIYNKTLFDQYGWGVPKTFNEFVALCVQIREDTNGTIQPWNPNAKYDTVFSTALEAFTYAELFGGAYNRGWYNDFCEGDASFSEHMEPLYELIQSLADNGILLEEHFDYSATTRGKEFEDGKIAMYNAPISRINSDKYTFDYMPYPTTIGESRFVNDYFSSILCVPKQEHTDAESDAIDRFINFFGSVEGQKKLIGDSLMASNVKGVPLNESEAMSGISAEITRGNTFSLLDFQGSGERTWSFRENALAMVKGEKTSAEIIMEIDKNPYRTAEESEVNSDTKIADVTENFTILEFSCYIADMYREAAEADIGLINHGVAYRGNLVRLFAGDIYERYMYPIKPRSFENGSRLVKVSMTGQQLMDALNNPVGNECVSDSIYAFSGLKCEVAPWNELGSKYISVKLDDGSELDKEKLYTVAFWEGSVAEKYITETIQTYEGSWEEHMSSKFKADGAVAPANDGRIKLIF